MTIDTITTTEDKHRCTTAVREITTQLWGLQHRPFPQLSDKTSLTFTRKSDRIKTGQTSIQPNPRAKLRNNISFAIGYIELSNVADIAANVYNKVPIPGLIKAVMVLGGTVCGGMLFFITRDAMLSWQNLRGLSSERKHLVQALAALDQARRNPEMGQQSSMVDDTRRTLLCFLQVNRRDAHAELVYRFGMECVVAVGSLLVGIGTYMAVLGENPKWFETSNLLTGYLGNSPFAFCGMVNLVWACVTLLHLKSRRGTHVSTVKAALDDQKWLQERLRQRAMYIRLHGLLNGGPGLLAGAMSLATATQWWAYVVLFPCIITSVVANKIWRTKIGYERPFFAGDGSSSSGGGAMMVSPITEEELVRALKDIDHCRRRLTGMRLVSSTMGFRPLLEFILHTNLFEDFCLRLSRDEFLCERLFPAVCGEKKTTVMVDALRLFKACSSESDEVKERLVRVARKTVSEEARKGLEYRERWLLEVLGCYMALGDIATKVEWT